MPETYIIDAETLRELHDDTMRSVRDICAAMTPEESAEIQAGLDAAVQHGKWVRAGGPPLY